MHHVSQGFAKFLSRQFVKYLLILLVANLIKCTSYFVFRKILKKHTWEKVNKKGREFDDMFHCSTPVGESLTEPVS